MNNKNRVQLTSLALALLCITHTQAKDMRYTSYAKGACVIGAALLGAAGLMWCLSETDDQLLIRGSTLYDTVCANYRNLSRYLENGYNADPLTPALVEHILTEVREGIIYGLGLEVWNMGEQEYVFRSTLRSYCSQMNSLKIELAKRIYNLQSSLITHDQQEKLRTMRKLIKRVEDTLPHLMLLTNFFEKHAQYYTLFWNEARLLKQYSTELNTLSHYSNDHFLLSQHLNQHVIHQNTARYAYIAYVDQIDRDLSLLRDQIDRLQYHYSERMRYAQQLFQSLHYIKGVIASNPRYGHELYAQEQERLGSERVVALKNQLHKAEQERLKAVKIHQEIVENTTNAHSLQPNYYCD